MFIVMTRTLTTKAVDFDVNDIYGHPIKLSSFEGRAVILCFFRDTSSRSTKNDRIYELTKYCEEWRAAGVEIVTVFQESKAELLKAFKKRPRPFPVISDSKLKLFNMYGLKRVVGKDTVSNSKSTGKIASLFKGRWAWMSPVGRVMPAEFLITTEGNIRHAWHGRDNLDHISLDRLETFVMSIRVETRKRQLALERGAVVNS